MNQPIYHSLTPPTLQTTPLYGCATRQMSLRHNTGEEGWQEGTAAGTSRSRTPAHRLRPDPPRHSGDLADTAGPSVRGLAGAVGTSMAVSSSASSSKKVSISNLQSVEACLAFDPLGKRLAVRTC